jgi:protein phosphatase 1 regulatory subunit 7
MIPFNRIDNPTQIDVNLIDSEIKSGKTVILQYSEKIYDDNTLSILNQLCEKYDEKFEIRFYGFYTEEFDFKTLTHLTNVKSLLVDCLTSAKNIESLASLNNLQKLSLGVYELKETEILNYPNLKTLKELIITDTKTKALNLEYLSEYKKLKVLFSCGHQKNIKTIGELTQLEHLSLHSSSKITLDFINKLKKVKTLSLMLGGKENINEIDNPNIEELEIIRVRGFNDLGDISRFPNLKKLHIEDQIKLEQINFKTSLPKLKSFKLLNCKTFNELTGLINLPQLEELIINRTSIDFNKFFNQQKPSKIKHFGFYTTKSKPNKEIKRKLLENGYSGCL